jgi:hypothetical protein
VHAAFLQQAQDRQVDHASLLGRIGSIYQLDISIRYIYRVPGPGVNSPLRKGLLEGVLRRALEDLGTR